jgi:hypothetical protein
MLFVKPKKLKKLFTTSASTDEYTKFRDNNLKKLAVFLG